ncbi:MAG: alternative ribosome rescue aminoacyl-tRNA hydrolase ArfB [Planctomycetaceae bacterium]
MLRISPNITIPDEELHFTFSRSAGPGGQNVNKVNSKATLHWNPSQSAVIPPGVLARFLAANSSKITTSGDIVISSQEYRDQPKNTQACLDKLKQMLCLVLVPPKRRKPTKPTKGSQVRRLAEKKSRSQVKQGRQGKPGMD